MKASRSSVPKGFDFGSDDVLCPYTDHNPSVNHQPYLSPPPPPPPPPNKPEVREYASRRFSSGNSSYDEGGYSCEVILTVEKAMKKYSSNLFSFLEGINGRLSQLELLCSTVEQDINEFHSELAHKHNDENLKFIDLVKHLQEVQRSVQIMRDKQELAETQKELSKLQLVHESDAKHTDSKTEAAVSTTELTKVENVPDPRNFASQTRNVTGYTMLPNQNATLVSLPSAAADQNILYKQEPFQSSSSSTLPPAKSVVEFQKQGSASQQPYHYNQMKSNIPYHAPHSYQTKHEPDPCRIQNPQTAQPYQNESSSCPLPYQPRQQPWVSPGLQPQFSQPQEQTEIRTERTLTPSVPFYSYHVPTAQRTMVVSSQQMFPNQLVPQSSGVPQPSPASQSEERSGHDGNYGYRYPSASPSNYQQQQQQMQPPPIRQANPNEINRAPHYLPSTYSSDVSKVVYNADINRHPYSHYYQQQNRQQ